MRHEDTASTLSFWASVSFPQLAPRAFPTSPNERVGSSFTILGRISLQKFMYLHRDTECQKMTRAQCYNGLGLQVGDGYSRAGSLLGLLAGGLLGRGLLLDRLLGGHSSETHCCLCCCFETGVLELLWEESVFRAFALAKGKSFESSCANSQKILEPILCFSTNRVISIWGKFRIHRTTVTIHTPEPSDQ